MRDIYSLRVPESFQICIADLNAPQHSVCRHWHITRINVPINARRNGYGSRLLAMIISDADAEGATLCLDPMGSGEMSTEDLIKWYERHGFVMKPDKCVMIREPNGTKY